MSFLVIIYGLSGQTQYPSGPVPSNPGIYLTSSLKLSYSEWGLVFLVPTPAVAHALVFVPIVWVARHQELRIE
jgi:hypothetical protein